MGLAYQKGVILLGVPGITLDKFFANSSRQVYGRLQLSKVAPCILGYTVDTYSVDLPPNQDAIVAIKDVGTGIARA